MNRSGNAINRRRGARIALLAVAACGVLGVSGAVSAAPQAVPVNTGEPAISGNAVVGATLTATAGTWANNPTSFRYQWLRCPSSGGRPDGSDCGSIKNADSQSYVVRSADTGRRLRVRVTASNADGSRSAASNPTAIVGSAPRNTALPSISGTARVGSTLKTTTGSWTGNPTSFTFQWLRCPASGGKADGSDCTVLAGATGQTYVLVAADLGHRMRVRVTAANAAGSATATSNASGTVQAASSAPFATAEPTISGTLRVGSILTGTQGTWRNNPTAFSYQWMRCPASGGKPDASDCAVIAGATALTYTLTSADAGARLRLRVTASNASGSSSVASDATAVVQAGGPPGCPAGTGPIAADQVVNPARIAIGRGQIFPSVVTRTTRTITTRFRVSACNGRPVQGALVYAAAVPFNQFTVGVEQPTDGSGFVTMTMQRLRGFPAARTQHLLVVFVRARKPSETVLAASARRLVSFRVDLRR